MTSAPAPGHRPDGGEVVRLFATPPERARVLLVDDHELLGQILVNALNAEGHPAEAVSGPTGEAILAAAAEFQPDVVMLDIDLGPGIGSGHELLPALTSLGARVLMLTGSTDRLTYAECVEAGARGVVNKDASFDDLVTVIRTTAAGDAVLSEPDRQDLLALLRRSRHDDAARRAPFERLTPRERQVLAGLMEGSSAAEIASNQFVSLATVRSQIRSILVKLGVTSQLAAVALARQEGWIEL